MRKNTIIATIFYCCVCLLLTIIVIVYLVKAKERAADTLDAYQQYVSSGTTGETTGAGDSAVETVEVVRYENLPLFTSGDVSRY